MPIRNPSRLWRGSASATGRNILLTPAAGDEPSVRSFFRVDAPIGAVEGIDGFTPSWTSGG